MQSVPSERKRNQRKSPLTPKKSYKREDSPPRPSARVGGRLKKAKIPFDPSSFSVSKRRHTEPCFPIKKLPIKKITAGSQQNVCCHCKKTDKPEALIHCKGECETRIHLTCLQSMCERFGKDEELTWECYSCQTCTMCNKNDIDDLKIGCGLFNLKNSCFFNSTFQALFYIPKIVDCLLLEIEKNKHEKQEKCITCAVLNLFQVTQRSRAPYIPIQLYQALKETNEKLFDILNGSQQDPHEFLMLLTEEIFRQKHSFIWFENNFIADVQTVRECLSCKNVYKVDGVIGDFSIEIRGQISIQSSLDSYFSCEYVDDFKCKFCKKEVSVKKQYVLVSAPSCLCIQLKRFCNSTKKINSNIEITPELVLSKYFAKSPDYEYKYKLVSVINHLGETSDSGHYTTIVCAQNDEYYEFDDNVVRKISANTVEGSKAYMLFYEITADIVEDEDQAEKENQSLYEEHEVNHSNTGDQNWNNEVDFEQCYPIEIVGDDDDETDLIKEVEEELDFEQWTPIEIDIVEDEVDQIQKVKENQSLYEEREVNSRDNIGYLDLSNVVMLSPSDELEDWTEVEIVDAADTNQLTEVKIADKVHKVQIDCSIQSLNKNFQIIPDINNEREETSLTRIEAQNETETESETEITRIEAQQHETETESETETGNISQYKNVSGENIERLSGRRIVDIDYLFNQMKNMSVNACRKCNEGAMSFVSEIKRGLISVFKFQCTSCGVKKRVESCPLKNNSNANINEGAVIGIVSIGLGHYHLQELLAHLDIKCMSYPTYHAMDKKLQTNAWGLAKKLEEVALLEEIRLAIECGDVDSAGNALIAVEFDGSWGKRSYGKNFSSLSGCASIIGLRTRKILYSDVKNKYCHTCKIAQSKITPPNKHDCTKNYDGPSSGMETQIIVEGFKFCAEKGARFTRYVGDGDSSTYKALRDLRLYKNPDLDIEKFECVNHLFRNFLKKFTILLGNTKFNLKGRKLLSAALGGDICIGVRMAAEHWRLSDIDTVQKYTNLERDVLNAPLHYLGVHDKCQQYFCEKTTDPLKEIVISVLKDTGVYYEILDLCQYYFANNSKSLIANLSTNRTEGFNSLIAKTLGGKRVCNSLGNSYKSRTAISDVQFNTEGHSGSTYHEYAFGEILQSCLNLENVRKRKVEKNAIAKKSKPKKKRFNEPTKKASKRKLYGAGREEVDSSPSAYELAKARFLERLLENQMNRNVTEFETRGQRHILKWMEIRRNLLTPSYFGRILNVNSRNSYTKIVEEILYKNVKYANTAEIRHQRIFEMEAMQFFSDLYGCESISTCGIFIDTEFCFFGTSPFRLFEHDSIISVKCPKAAFKKSMKEAISKNLIPFWTGPSSDRRINLKSHWYYEIQGQLRITGRRFAYLVIYLGESVYEIIEKIERNDDFWKNAMEKELTFFYNEAMLKELIDSRDERGMDLRKYNTKRQTFE